MKVLQILPELNSGGVERGTVELAAHLVRHGHQSLVVSNGGRLVEPLERGGTRHLCLPVHRKSLWSLWQVPVLRRLLLQEQPDILHLRSRLPAWLAYLAWRKLPPGSRPQLITTVHGFYSVNSYSRIMTAGQRVICVSESVRDYVRASYPKVPDERLTVIHRGVDPAGLPYGYRPTAGWLQRWRAEAPQATGCILLTLPARITRWKGPLDFVEVVRQLRAQGLPVHGLLVGEAHPRKAGFLRHLRQVMSAAGVDRHITLLGHRSDLREIMAVSDVVLSLSRTAEAFGRVSLEALSIGKPVAAYDHGGVREQLQALLPEGRVAVGDVSGVVRLLGRWLRGEPPRPAADNPFTLARMLDSTIRVYESQLRTDEPAANSPQSAAA